MKSRALRATTGEGGVGGCSSAAMPQEAGPEGFNSFAGKVLDVPMSLCYRLYRDAKPSKCGIGNAEYGSPNLEAGGRSSESRKGRWMAPGTLDCGRGARPLAGGRFRTAQSQISEFRLQIGQPGTTACGLQNARNEEPAKPVRNDRQPSQIG